MKKNRLILILALALIGAAAFLIYKNTGSSIRTEDRDFAVKDTSLVTKIFIADRAGSSVTLEKQADKTWMVNRKFQVRKDAIKNLLECINRVRVQTRVPKPGFNSVIKELASTGIKCEIYVNDDEKPVKVYYVGGSTQDVLGTYMMLENSTVPFITEIPGFQGYLTPRYSSAERDWKSSVIVDYTPADIKSVTLLFNEHPDKSFTIEKAGNTWAVLSPITNTRLDNPDTLRIKNYMTYFRNLSFETWDHSFSDAQTDSLRHATPSTVLTIIDLKGTKTVLPMYPKPITATSIAQSDSLGRALKYDLDRMYGFINDGKDLVTLQYFVFGKLFVSIDDLDLSKRRNPAVQSHR